MRPAVLGFVLLVAACTRSQAPSQLPTEPEVRASGSWLHFTGPITRASVEVLRQSLADRSVSGLSISSVGGDVEAALEIAKVVQDRRLEVEVRNWCMSSCANYIFPSGTRKRIAEGAIVAWHGSPGHLHFLDLSGQGSADPVIREHNAALAKREADFLRAAGVDPYVSWFGKVSPYNTPNFYALTVEGMSAFGITEVAAPLSYGPGYLATLPEGLRRGIVFIPADAEAIKAGRPQWLR